MQGVVQGEPSGLLSVVGESSVAGVEASHEFGGDRMQAGQTQWNRALFSR